MTFRKIAVWLLPLPFVLVGACQSKKTSTNNRKKASLSVSVQGAGKGAGLGLAEDNISEDVTDWKLISDCKGAPRREHKPKAPPATGTAPATVVAGTWVDFENPEFYVGDECNFRLEMATLPDEDRKKDILFERAISDQNWDRAGEQVYFRGGSYGRSMKVMSMVSTIVDGDNKLAYLFSDVKITESEVKASTSKIGANFSQEKSPRFKATVASAKLMAGASSNQYEVKVNLTCDAVTDAKCVDDINNTATIKLVVLSTDRDNNPSEGEIVRANNRSACVATNAFLNFTSGGCLLNSAAVVADTTKPADKIVTIHYPKVGNLDSSKDRVFFMVAIRSGANAAIEGFAIHRVTIKGTVK